MILTMALAASCSSSEDNTVAPAKSAQQPSRPGYAELLRLTCECTTVECFNEKKAALSRWVAERALPPSSGRDNKLTYCLGNVITRDAPRMERLATAMCKCTTKKCAKTQEEASSRGPFGFLPSSGDGPHKARWNAARTRWEKCYRRFFPASNIFKSPSK